jgi:hypothetical protein
MMQTWADYLDRLRLTPGPSGDAAAQNALTEMPAGT